MQSSPNMSAQNKSGPHYDVDALQQQYQDQSVPIVSTENAKNPISDPSMYQNYNQPHPLFVPGYPQQHHSFIPGEFRSDPPGYNNYMPPNQYQYQDIHDPRILRFWEEGQRLKKEDDQELERIEQQLRGGCCIFYNFYLSIIMINGLLYILFFGLIHPLLLINGVLLMFGSFSTIVAMKSRQKWKIIVATVFGFFGGYLSMLDFALSVQGGHFDVSPENKVSLVVFTSVSFGVSNPIIFLAGATRSLLLLSKKNKILKRQINLDNNL